MFDRRTRGAGGLTVIVQRQVCHVQEPERNGARRGLHGKGRRSGQKSLKNSMEGSVSRAILCLTVTDEKEGSVVYDDVFVFSPLFDGKQGCIQLIQLPVVRFLRLLRRRFQVDNFPGGTGSLPGAAAGGARMEGEEGAGG